MNTCQLLKPYLFWHSFILDLVLQCWNAVVILIQLAVTLQTFLRHACWTLTFVSINRKSIKNLPTVLKWTHNQSELAHFVAVDHNWVNSEVIFATLLWTFKRCSVICLSDKWMNGSISIYYYFASYALLFILFKTRLTDGLLALRALNRE